MDATHKCIDQAIGDAWTIYNGDCCEVITGLPDDSMHYSIFSPPFASLYTYSDSERDMGNSATYEEFWEHFNFMISHLIRIMMPGRLVSVHCMNIPTTIQNHGEIGIQDFRGDIIRSFVAAGFTYHSEVCIWKDPAAAMQRTKALGLLHKQLTKDSCRSRMAIPDYVCTFRKRGDNPEPVDGELDTFSGDPETFERTSNLSIDIWQRYASPIWSDIRMNRTLNAREGRSPEDERHICPLQLDVIERCLQLWTNEWDTVFSPFAGIGSEGVCAVEMNRRFVGIELKESYFKAACKNLQWAVETRAQGKLF